MDLTGIKLVVTDMDGTLLNSEHKVSSQFFELFRELRSLGLEFAAASGRQYLNIVSKLEPIKDEIFFIAENGGLLVRDNKTLLKTPLPRSDKDSVVSIVRDIPDAVTILCTPDNALMNTDKEHFINRLSEYYTKFELCDDLEAYSEEVMKVAVYHPVCSEEHLFPSVSHLIPDLQVKISGTHWVDVSHKDANKGFALEELQGLLGLSPQETLVFGDFHNDLEMLQRSDHSFAMANAHPEVLKIARYKTLSNDQRGVEVILEKLLSALS